MKRIFGLVILIGVLLAIGSSGVKSSASIYNFMGIAEPSATHKTTTGEIIVSDPQDPPPSYEDGTYANTIVSRDLSRDGLTDYKELKTGDYGKIASSNDDRYADKDPDTSRYSILLHEFYIDENPSTVTRIDVLWEGYQDVAADKLWLLIWNYQYDKWHVLEYAQKTSDYDYSGSITSNPDHFIDALANNQITILAFNQDEGHKVYCNYVEIEITFVSVTAPTVINSTGASNVTTTAARLNGEVTSTGGEDPTVHIYWGDNDGGVTPGNWDHVEDLGTKGVETFYKDISNLSPNTTYYYRCYATNSGGSDWANSSASFTTSAPTGSITINNGATYTNSRNVTLTLEATNVSHMCFSNDNSSWSEWEDYATEKSWRLTSGDGTKTVYVKFKDGAGNISETYSDNIILDTTPPIVTITSPTANTMVNKEVTITWKGSDPDDITPAEDLVYQHKLVGHPDYSEWSDWSSETSKTYMLSSGNYTFKVRAKDEAGNYPAEDDPATAKSSFTVSLPIIVYPNPCYLNQGQIVTIDNLSLTSEVKIYIYDLGGNLIRTLGESETTIQGGSKLVVWDCRNNNGEVVTRDIYIYFILSATEKKTGKIAIIK